VTSASGPQPPARRDNGLRADQFVALADVDPRLGEHLLDLLRLAEIPAYLEPTTDPRVAVRYRVSGPVERLYVHADQRQEARAVVVAAAHEAGESADTIVADPVPTPPPPVGSRARPDVLDGIDTDAEFARIVAGFSGPVGPTPTRADPINRRGIDPADLVVDPADPGLPTPAELDASADATARARDAAERAADEHDTAFDAGLTEDDSDSDEDDHFYPPPAPPFPVPTANTVGAVALVVLAILVLVRGDLLGLDATMSFPAGVIALLVATGLIIRGLRDHPEPGEGPEDDGAEV
jgi:hypothetical protein